MILLGCSHNKPVIINEQRVNFSSLPITPECYKTRFPVVVEYVDDKYCMDDQSAKNSITNLEIVHKCLDDYKEYGKQIIKWREENDK